MIKDRLALVVKRDLIRNAIKINTHNTLEHELAKCKLVYLFKSKYGEVYTEVEFKTGGRCDIFVPEIETVIEVLHTETRKECLKKTSKYPDLNLIFLETKKVLESNFDIEVL